MQKLYDILLITRLNDADLKHPPKAQQQNIPHHATTERLILDSGVSGEFDEGSPRFLSSAFFRLGSPTFVFSLINRNGATNKIHAPGVPIPDVVQMTWRKPENPVNAVTSFKLTRKALVVASQMGKSESRGRVKLKSGGLRPSQGLPIICSFNKGRNSNNRLDVVKAEKGAELSLNTRAP